MEAKEIYVTKGLTPISYYVLTILSDGVVHLAWYYGQTKIIKKNPCLTKCLNGMKVEFDEPNDSGVRPHIELLDYDSGELCDRWEKIK